MYKISKIVALVFAVLAIILFGGLVYSDIDPYTELMFYTSYILLFASILAVTVFGLLNIVSSPKKLKKTLIYTGVFFAIVLLSYAFASGENNTEKLVETGIISFYILGAVATGLMIYSGIKSAIVK
ncbi:hypothetical protein [Capnocytophaga canimorsus]|uniref:Uncharacterized protein n=2 Tax=Capnocytophaga canimorsus TaxID=28188 RepID=F9YR28_CAPCC|nr:hypothetical protein [Capnocytophaga canimorsus]AEK23638.1 Conserved hypothetical protein [Capnocytophaga canimorsus Cc5]ATA76647.1 hypothetical protein CGC47_03120 [Capnocytophaga canimorsus]ATA91260.1 hypothetical protein CGC56_03215 [Capnocytophaga canimorsus]ATA93369.1 hypothetical protein CGC54_02965 [Capnocytophaga canimorsus]AWL78107.1 hypothetical protein DKB58_03685 [Capnocytophaga canimorsus]